VGRHHHHRQTAKVKLKFQKVLMFRLKVANVKAKKNIKI
jgi:hypothetical protein